MRFIFTIILFVFVQTAFSQTYFNIYVNGVDSSSITQGDLIAWEFDVFEPGASADLQLILDVNENGTFDEGDIVLAEFTQTDGQTGEDGPGDSSEVEDGMVYSDLGPFGFAPAHYLFIVSDGENPITNTLQVFALSDPPATISGAISKEGISPPSADLQNIMVIGTLQNGFVGFWTGLSDDQGNYSINVPPDGIGQVWEIDLFQEDYDGYVVLDQYENETINAGDNGGFNFQFSLPSSFVYGRLIDDQEQDVIIDDYAVVRNRNNGDDFTGEIIDGHFNVAVSLAGQDSAEFQLEIWGDNLIPNYMKPQLWNDTSYTFTLQDGDSLEKNIFLQIPNADIYVQVYIDNEEPGMEFKVEAYDDMGETFSFTAENGFGTLAVVDSGYYHVSINTDVDNGTPLPMGFTLDGQSQVDVMAGDTARFYIIGASSSISGSLSFAEGDAAINWQTDDFRIYAMQSEWNDPVGVNPDDSLQYRFDLLDGSYAVWFEDYGDNFLSMPDTYQAIDVESSDVEDLDFELNLRHANLVVKMVNAPFNPQYEWWNIATDGEMPFVYQTSEEGGEDSTYHFRVCDGDWNLVAPYSNDTISITVTVTNEKTDYFLEIDYNSGNIVSALDDLKNNAPHSFKLEQNFPNPFNPFTTIRYALANDGKVNITVFDIIGKEVAQLVNTYQTAGNYSLKFAAGSLPSGIYFYRIETSKGFTQTRKMLLVK